MDTGDLDANDRVLETVRAEVQAAVHDIYEAARRLQTILDTRLPELRKRGDPHGT